MWFILIAVIIHQTGASGFYEPVSCYDHLHATISQGEQPQDGFYNISQNGVSHSAYCDMTQDDGGWLLMVGTSTGLGWNAGNIYDRNSDQPGLNIDFSMLEIAEEIKDRSFDTTFEYRIEGGARGRWGGIWRAPVTYSVASEDNTQTNIEEVIKFDTYQYNDGQSIGFRVPWVHSTHAYALLTTAPRQTSPWWGTIICSQTTGWGVNAWIEQQYSPVGYVNDVKPFYYWIRDHNKKLELQVDSQASSPNHCEHPEYFIDDDINTCGSVEDINPGCISAYTYNASSATSRTEVNLHGQNLHQASVYVNLVTDTTLRKLCTEKLSEGTTHRMFDCDLSQGYRGLGLILLFDKGTGFSLCELNMLTYTVQ